MCIRDRHVAELVKALRARGDIDVQVRAFGQTQVEPGTTGSVSYKHLRAHETVLDLVCRLLLEKHKLPHHNQHTVTQPA